MDNNYDILLAKYFGGSATQQEMVELENYIAASEENQIVFDQYTQLYGTLGLSKINVPHIDIAKAKSKYLQQISKIDSNKQKHSLKKTTFNISKPWMYAAASIAILIGIATLFWTTYFADKEIVISSSNEVKFEVLPNNTKVFLYENSTIKYNSKGNKSTIDLVGQANFNVKNKGEATLVVQAGETFIKDIGTQFDVKAFPASDVISVSVSDGQVKFYTSTNKGITLNASESALYNKKTKIFTFLAKKKIVDNVNEIVINLDETQLIDALDIIQNAYNVKIELLDRSFAQLPITVNFEGESLQTVLDVLSETLHLNSRMKGEVYQLFASMK